LAWICKNIDEGTGKNAETDDHNGDFIYIKDNDTWIIRKDTR